jgi:NAD(P)-dependent dehydrogenase (short-subunit alcohol dehydrogenase family)
MLVAPRLGTVDDVASTIAFLCSPGAAHINGQTIVVDGGWSTTKYLSPEVINAD